MMPTLKSVAFPFKIGCGVAVWISTRTCPLAVLSPARIPLFGLTWPSSLHMYGVASLLFPHDCVTLSQKGNWVDYEHEITLFAERNPGVKVVIYHKP